MKFKYIILMIIAALLMSAWGPMPVNWIAANEENAATASASTLTVNVNNKTGETITLKMTGSTNYTFTIKAGKSTINVAPGKYKYTYQACQGQKKGTVEVKKNNTNLVLAACNKNQKAAGGLVKIVIQNNTGGYITLNLTGPSTYQFSLGTGKSTISVAKGTYQYVVYGCGASLTGTKKFNGKFVWTFWCS